MKNLEIGTKVRVQHPISKTWENTGVIVEVGSHRKYRIHLSTGKTIWRNRKFIRVHSISRGGIVIGVRFLGELV